MVLVDVPLERDAVAREEHAAPVGVLGAQPRRPWGGGRMHAGTERALKPGARPGPTNHSPQLAADATLARANPALALDQGFIALQSESHPIDFRRVALRALGKE